ncbi:unnamed protein product [Amoebophrya sp. A25]|nr:unnamed protein product [Amoebophrya sp. A25]|eukprot:GSA25T00004870001.1
MQARAYSGVMPPAPVNVRQQRPARALVGFSGSAPKFIPPSYDNIDPSDLPCPDTPSPRSEQENASEHDEPSRQHPAGTVNYETMAPMKANTTGSRAHASRHTPSQQTRGAVDTAAPITYTGGHPYPPGAFVEYRSRTMHDRWILAKVESYDEKNGVYRLDVQPKAPRDRVRLRGGQQPPQQTTPSEAVQPGAEPEPNPLHQVDDPIGEELRQASADELRQKCRELMMENEKLRSELAEEKRKRKTIEQQARAYHRD